MELTQKIEKDVKPAAGARVEKRDLTEAELTQIAGGFGAIWGDGKAA